ncbi:ABC-type transport auxiliary lipoprotein family protein [Marinobacter salexigens]|uniref:Membrane integrity-associated transporter subunit PqiC n=1 Tax=Marinobacter salexigens TaxID=1925763 RepID=A0ABS6A6Z3_9GAMM|nr:ABC-type transport auxiliary lipoprotein family protein [Marinobacter salexigens]MBU2873963.1 membrane integrity-associated transporter subunit PqiC [Marinobacter salexigens]
MIIPAAKAIRAFGTVMAVSGALTACTVFPIPEAPRVMDFPVPEELQNSGTSRPESLRVDTPFASEPYNSSRILAKPEPWEFTVYSGVRWRDTAPVLLRDMLAGAFRASDVFRDVVIDTGPSNSDLTLATEISAFHTVNHGDSARVTVTVYGQLINNRSRQTLCSSNFIVSAPAKDKSINSVVQAFGDAGEELAINLIDWARNCEAR